MAFSKVLVANRGEIAVRIIRSLKECGVRTTAIYSEADKDCLHVRLADEAYPIGPPPALKSYLQAGAIVELAARIQAQAVHPGYGFLAENAQFAALCQEAGLCFIGPTPDNLRLAGDKRRARQVVEEAGVPVIPGSHRPLLSVAEAQEVCRSMSYPLLLKASAGGGGRGMRAVAGPGDLADEFVTAAAEARAVFGDPTLYVEQRINRPKHIEVQILADSQGRVVHLMERNCSVQRRHQKLIEEAPAPGLTQALRESLHRAAVTIAKTVGYHNAGTIEFLVDQEQRFYFMEINARIQVEHPVTEMILGLDLIKAQLAIAEGRELGLRQEEIRARGHAIECRINAEDPALDFLPDPGRVEQYHAPGGFGVRFDTHLYQGYEVPIFYDPMLGKLITWGASRPEALARMQRCLDELVVEPIKTTTPFHLQVIRRPEFIQGDYRLDLAEQLLQEMDSGSLEAMQA
ncbi:MAG: acetyl-CoA carboxylase biotin carboxylase subunit [Thermodesulfobacteriota bacterium]